MSEIKKMYENAGFIQKRCKDYSCIMCDKQRDCNKYPPFTAEKQLKLIKWLSTKELKIRTNKQPYAVYIGLLGNDNTCFYGCEGLFFEQTLAELVNIHWQDLTEEEKEQIKEILK